MSITVTCTCGAQFRVKDEHAGRQAKCPHCNESMTIPDDIDDEAEEDLDVEDYADDDSVATTPQPRRRKKKSLFGGWSFGGAPGTLLGMNRTCGMIMLLLGLMMALVSRGCSTIAGRAKSRANAKYELLQNEFADKQVANEAEVEETIAELNESRDDLSKSLSNPDRADERTAMLKRLNELEKAIAKERKELQEIQADGKKEQLKLQRGKWRDQYESARDSLLYKSTGSYWREWIFVIGTVILSVGLLTVGFTGEGSERTICLIMIAIITFSLYIGGVAWIDSISDSVESMRNSPPQIR